MLTDSGWIMIEGNARGQFLRQMPTPIGFSSGYLKEMGINVLEPNMGGAAV